MSRFGKIFADAAKVSAREMGRAWAFAVAIGTVILWAASGPLFDYSDTWQLVINTGTTIATFLMVFLIQNSQNRDAAAVQVKLDELIRVSRANNVFIGLEYLSDEELDEIKKQTDGARERATRRAKHGD